MGKKSVSGSRMNNPDHISESLETIFWGLKYLNSLMRIRDGRNSYPPSGKNIPDPQHCSYLWNLLFLLPSAISLISSLSLYILRPRLEIPEEKINPENE
jgi:hypothetical protein